MLDISTDNTALWSVLMLSGNASYLFKIVFLGEGAVGKTSLVGRFVYDSFEGDYLATIGTDIHLKMVQVEDTSKTCYLGYCRAG